MGRGVFAAGFVGRGLVPGRGLVLTTTSSCADGEGLEPVVAGAAPAPGDGRLRSLVGMLVGGALVPVGGAGELLSAAGDEAGVILSGSVA